MNTATLIGRMVRDPELRYTPSGTAMCRFTVAVDRGMNKDKRAEAESKGYPTADFIPCQAWSGTAEKITKYFSKGKPIALEGSIQTGSYTKDDGTKVFTTNVNVRKFYFIESKGGSGGADQPTAPVPEPYADPPVDDNFEFPF